MIKKEKKEKTAPKSRGKARKYLKKKVPLWLVCSAVICVCVVVIFIYGTARISPPKEPQVITVSLLEDIIEISDVSTYEAIYNGIATVMNEKKQDKVDYYVSYEAKILVGFDMKQVKINLDEEVKKITVTVPGVKINDIQVDFSSMDFIFYNNKSNKTAVTEQAYKMCNDDVEKEAKKNEAVLVFAQEAAVNFVDALIRPFVAQLDSEFVVEVRSEGVA